MSTVAKMAMNPKEAVLQTLREKPFVPIQLMLHLEKEKSLSEAAVKAAILDLLHEMRIEYGPDLKLRINAETPAAHV